MNVPFILHCVCKKNRNIISFSTSLIFPLYSILVITLTKVRALTDSFVVAFEDSSLRYLNVSLILTHFVVVVMKKCLDLEFENLDSIDRELYQESSLNNA